MIVPTLFSLSLVCNLALLAAQAPLPPTDTALAGITARGRALVAYDIAAWHGTDAVQALKPTEEISAAIVRHTASGRWEVFYGHLSASKDTMYAYYSASQAGPDSAYVGRVHQPPLVVTGEAPRFAAAIQTALADFGTLTRPYNSYAIPATPHGIWVYLLPAQTSLADFPHGADIRYWIDTLGTTIIGRHRFHQALLNLPAQPGAAGGWHTSFDPLPAETDVFLVLRRYPRLPEMVATEHFLYEIQRDGTIRWRPAKNP